MFIQHPEGEMDPSMNTLERIHDILGLGFLKTKHVAKASRFSVLVKETTGISLKPADSQFWSRKLLASL